MHGFGVGHDGGLLTPEMPFLFCKIYTPEYIYIYIYIFKPRPWASVIGLNTTGFLSPHRIVGNDILVLQIFN